METRSSHNFNYTFGTRNYLQDEKLFELGGVFDMPNILDLPQTEPPNLDFYPFHAYKGELGGVHFFIDDYLQNRVWNCPKRYYAKLAKAHTVFTPDFSPYTDYPFALQIYQIYRSRYITRLFQEQGFNVIPYVNYNDARTYEMAFSGIPKGKMLAMATQGMDKDLTLQGTKELLKILQPSKVFVYGLKMQNELNELFNNFIYIPTFWDLKRQKYKRNGKGQK